MISVIMPVYNAENYIEEAIISILKQTEQNFELIIINDCSTDKTKLILERYSSDKRVKLIHLDKNSGAAAARNIGIEEAEGEFIAFQDADDISLPNRLKMQKEMFISEDIGIVHTDLVLIDEQNNPLGYWHSQNLHPNRITRFFLKIGAPFTGGTLMLRKSTIQDLRYDETLKIGEDTDLLYYLSKKTVSIHIPEPLYMYRRHKKNTTSNFSYEEFIAHIQKFINFHTIEELIPEAETLLEAYSVLALFLMRRGLKIEAENWFQEASKHIKNEKDEALLSGIGNLMLGNIQDSIKFLEYIPNKNHIVWNYIGEAYATIGDFNRAIKCFQESLNVKGDYLEPVENLRALGSKSFNLVDTSWKKFLKNH